MDTERDCYYARPATHPASPVNSGRWVWMYALVSVGAVGLVVLATLSDAIALAH